MHQGVGLGQVHRALDPFGAQVQVAHLAIVREIDFGKGVGVFFQDEAIIPNRSPASWN